MSDAAVKAIEAGLQGETEQYAAPATLYADPDQDRTTTHSGKDGEMTRVPTTEDLEKGKEDSPAYPANDPNSGVLTGFQLYSVFGCLMGGVFLFALDQSIVATAIPILVSDFHAFQLVSWVITAYFLTQCGLILLVGQLLTIVKAKWVLLVAFFFFELGSLIAGVAPSMNVLIFGRAIQGVGCSGMFSSMMLIITVITRVEQRAAFMASFGFVFVISSVVGPLLGGVFTQHATWRWCFYINLPIGGLAAAGVVFLLPARDPPATEQTKNRTTLQRIARLDYVGAALILSIVVCLLLALSWGGNQYRWDSWRIILLFTLGGCLVIVFGAWEYKLDKRALVPREIIKNRTVIAASIAVWMTMCVMLGGTYQLPLYYEAVRNHSPTKAGIDILPFMIACCVAIFISGGATTATGRYWPWLLIGPPFAATGFGLLYTVTPDTPSAKLIGYQILSGVGIGFSFQNIMLAVQAEFHDRPHLMPQAVGVSNFFQLTGAAIGIGIVNTVQSIFLNSALHSKAPDAPFDVVRQSVTAIYTIPENLRASVISAYVEAITKSFLPIFIAVAIAFVSSIFVRNHNLKAKGGAGAMAA